MNLTARKWQDMSYQDQIEYLKRHKNSRLKPMSLVNEELNTIKRLLKIQGPNQSIESKQDRAEQQVQEWSNKLYDLGLTKVYDTGSLIRFENDNFIIDLQVNKGKMKYFANINIKPKINYKRAFLLNKISKTNLRKKLLNLFTNGLKEEFVELLNKNWFNPLNGGLADDKYPIDFDINNLIKGIKIEFEHTSDVFRATKIAMDHLTEDKTYYNDIKKMSTRRIIMFRHLAKIHEEFVRLARKWEDLTFDLQKEYLNRHPGSKRKVTAQPPAKSETSGLKIYEPKRSQSRDVLDFMRDSINAQPGSQPTSRSYVTMRDGGHNKYHYFAIMPDVAGNFVAGNVYGRIGYPPKGIAILARTSDPKEAEFALRKKLDKKLMRGYSSTSM